jgi:signal transduction histidine kinase
MQRTLDGLIQAAVEHAHTTLHADVGFAALPTDSDEFRIKQTLGIADPRWDSIVVRSGLGLGGQVLASGRPMGAMDYANDERISRDFVEIVSGGEGLQTVLCVPILGSRSTECLLYVGSRNSGILGESALDVLKQIATFVGVGLEQERTRELERELERLRERERLASSLHDSVAQRLFAIGALTTALRGESDLETLLSTVDEISVTAGDARKELRETLLHLNNDSEHLSFHLQLDGELKLLETTTGCATRSSRRGRSRQMPRHVERLLIDAAVEGTRNAIKHCASQLVAVEVNYEPGRVCLVVEDKLPGRVPPSAAPQASRFSGTGVGLSALRARAERIGGSLMLEQGRSNAGTLVMTLPLIASPS